MNEQVDKQAIKYTKIKKKGEKGRDLNKILRKSEKKWEIEEEKQHKKENQIKGQKEKAQNNKEEVNTQNEMEQKKMRGIYDHINMNER